MPIKPNEITVILKAEGKTSPGFTRHDHIDADHEKWTRTFEKHSMGEHQQIDKEELPPDLYQDENYAVIFSHFRQDGTYGDLYCLQYRKYPGGTYQMCRINHCDEDVVVRLAPEKITLSDIPRFHGAREMETQRVLLQTCRDTTRCVQKQIRLEDDSAPLKSFTQMYVDGSLLCILESSRTADKHTHEIILWPVGNILAANGEKIDFYERIKRPRREMWIDGEFSEEIELPATYEGIWSHAKEAWDFWQPKRELTGHEIDKTASLVQQEGRMQEIDHIQTLLRRMRELTV